MKRPNKTWLAIVLAAAAAAIGGLFVLRSGERPARTSWDWKSEWREAARLERANVARRMVRKEVLEGLALQECLSVLGTPTSLWWSEDPSGATDSSRNYYVIWFQDGPAEGSVRDLGRDKGALDEADAGPVEPRSDIPTAAALVWFASDGKMAPTNKPGDWVMAWKKATPHERARIAGKMDKEEPLKGFSAAQCIDALGLPQQALWGSRIEHWTGWGPGGSLLLIVDLDEGGFVKSSAWREVWP